MSYDDYDQDAAEARFDDEMAQLERISELESLISDMWHEMATCPDYPTPLCMTRNICDRIRELGIEVSA